MYKEPVIGHPEKPLVSVLIFNYNYGRYLRHCFDSVFAQTYENFEISFSDNASTDESWDIALEYARRYPGIITITCNRKNFGADANFANCWANARGKYFIELCSDDALMPEFLERCVGALEKHHEAGFAMVHRFIIDDQGQTTEEPPFYNRSCVIPGAEQAAVYMMAAVNPSVSQIMYNKKLTYEKSVTGSMAGRWYGTRLMDFNMCCEYPMVYIKAPLMEHRLHSLNDSFHAADNLMEVIGPYILHHQFAETASHHNLDKVVKRLPAANSKLSTLSLRYSVRALGAGDQRSGMRYFHLASALVPEVMTETIYQELKKYFDETPEKKKEILDKLRSTDNLETRSISYNPPPGSVSL